ncbi:hypothetical protein GH714_022573 [Hevea brasiliensis]|uniref:Receptor-like PK ALE2 N-terminal domain-containing protein n=1 Tax=Hevea brasiliensis TaxID=3981 RepID=A0A6A6NIP3_HEVBR|nr:hypothetical protein GH714_022573 [Hevea brasiliensis]
MRKKEVEGFGIGQGRRDGDEIEGRCTSIKKICSLLLHLLFVSCYVILTTNANLVDDRHFKELIVPPSRVPAAAPAILDLPLPANLPLFHKLRRKHLSPLGASSVVVAPAAPLNYGPLITSIHPPTSSHLSKPSMKKNALVPPTVGLIEIAPTQSNTSANASGLAQPPLSPHFSDCCKPDMVLKQGSHNCHCVYPIKLDFLLLNVSQNPNWDRFLQELASQLDLLVSQIELINFYVLSLSRLNISMDITPHTGISFSASDVSSINSSLALHKVHFDSTLVGDYRLLNLTWFEPPSPSQAPIVASSPVEAPAHQSATSTLPSNPGRGKHSNLFLILSIGVGIVIIAIISMLIICSCAIREGKPKGSPEGTVKPRTVDAVPAGGSLPHPSSTRDFKASNILLENNFHAKVADFGLAKPAPEGRTSYLSTRVMGTFGPILRDKDRLEELADPRLGNKYPKEDFVRVCTIAAACVAPESNQRPTMGEVVQSLKMVQHVTEYQDSMSASNTQPNMRQSSTTFESDGASSIFSSGPYSGLFDNDNISRTAAFSEDLHEGR